MNRHDQQQVKPVFLLTAFILIIFSITFLGPISYARSDSELSLLVSQAVIDHASIKLDAYQESVALSRYKSIYGEIKEKNDHFYYVFPIGPSIFLVPAVWIANLAGLHMTDPINSYQLQNLLSSWSCVFILLLVYRISRCYLPPRSSIVIAAVSILGSALTSTLGTALWNFHFTTIFYY